MEAGVPHESDDLAGQHDVAAPVLIAAICDRLADLTATDRMHAEYDTAVEMLIACGGGQVAALAKLQHLRRRLFCQHPPLDPKTQKDLALLDAAIGELADD